MSMTQEKSIENYKSHLFVTSHISSPDTRENVTYCQACGLEDRGDPLEFGWLEYPHCNNVGD